MADDLLRDSQVDGVQGAGEQRTEAVHNGTAKEQPQPATPQSAASTSRADGSAGRQAGAMREPENTDIEEAILYAKKYLEDLLSFFGLNIDIYATTEDHEVIELNVPSTHLNGFLIGVHGDTMRSLQYLISSALRSQNFSHTRVNVDVADYKKNRADRLADQAKGWFRDVKESGKTKELGPMNAADRRVVHREAEEYGLSSESVGEGRERHIVLKPSSELSRPSAEADTGEAARKSTTGKPAYSGQRTVGSEEEESTQAESQKPKAKSSEPEDKEKPAGASDPKIENTNVPAEEE